MLHIFHPNTYIPERKYIFDVLLREFLGLEYELHPSERTDVCITDSTDLTTPAIKTLILADQLFATPEIDWLAVESLPHQPFPIWNTTESALTFQLVEPRLPIIYGTLATRQVPLSVSETNITLSLDIFGSAFFCLTRYEEIVSPLMDTHGRFLLKASLAWQENFLHRPLVNEYLEILWALLSRLWPMLERKAYHHQVILSCDVDWPYCAATYNTLKVLRASALDITSRREPRLAWQRLRSHITAQKETDPCNTFEWIAGLSEHYGFPHAFYFIPSHSGGAIDGIYTLDDPWIRQLLRFVSSRHYEIGLHTSYQTFTDAHQTRLEKDKLIDVMNQEHITQEVRGGRQHYLRWKNPLTWQNWEDSTLKYDSTLTFAEHVGFRCGTCYEYPVFNLKSRRQLALHERPLIVMEASLLTYMKVSFSEAIAKVDELNRVCRQFNGNFTLLWHNSNLISQLQRTTYEEALRTLGS